MNKGVAARDAVGCRPESLAQAPANNRSTESYRRTARQQLTLCDSWRWYEYVMPMQPVIKYVTRKALKAGLEGAHSQRVRHVGQGRRENSRQQRAGCLPLNRLWRSYNGAA